MSLVPFVELMNDARARQYAVGYFESWNLESLLAVADAAQATHSPVLLGFSGIYLPDPNRRTCEYLADYFALAHGVASRLSVPTCLVFNESPHLDWVNQAIDLGFGLVMYTPESQSPISNLQSLVTRAHQSAAVEAELEPLQGVGGELAAVPQDLHLTNVERAREFVKQTGIDALAVNIGQAHLHGRQEVGLNLVRLRALREAIEIPLVLHGATSLRRDDLRRAIEIGIQKVNVGSALKRVYFETLKTAIRQIGKDYNPYRVVGSGSAEDVEMEARLALQKNVEEWMRLLGSAGKV